MKEVFKYRGTGNNGTFSWIMQRVSGIVILVCVAIHMFGMIFGSDFSLIRAVMGCVLAFGTWHAISGLKMITDDYVSCRCLRMILFFVYWILGIVLIIQGFSILP